MNQKTKSPGTEDWGVLTMFNQKKSCYFVHKPCMRLYPFAKDFDKQFTALPLVHGCAK